MKNLSIFVSCLLVAIASLAQAQTVDEIADSAYGEMDREVAKLETERQARQQAEFLAYVKAELKSFRCGMATVCTDTAFVSRFMAKLSVNVDEVVSSSKYTMCEKRGLFASIIGDMRKKIGLQAPAPVDTTTKVVVEKEVFVTSRWVSQAEINRARQDADWAKNIKNPPKKWWEKAGAYKYSEDGGKVMFAVGVGDSKDMQGAIDEAKDVCRQILTRAGAPSAGMYTVDTRVDEKKGYYQAFVLMAIPTSLLDKK